MLDLGKTVDAGIGAEFVGAELGDVRRSRRSLQVAECAMAAVVATTLLRHRVVEDFAHDKALPLGWVSEQIRLALRHVVGKLRRAFTATAKAVREALRPRPRSIVGGLAADLLRSHGELVAENVLLRQQLIVAARKVKRPVFQPHERGLITLLAAVLPRWRRPSAREAGDGASLAS